MRKIETYFPDVLHDVKEYKEIANTENPEIEIAWQSIDDLIDDQFIETSTERGVARREKLLKVTPSKADSLDDRKLRISLKWNDRLPYTYKVLKDKLDQIFGDNYEMERLVSKRLLKIKVNSFNWSMFDLVTNEIRQMIPANMILESTIHQRIESPFYIAVTILSGEEITVYPYSPRNIESKGSIYIGTGSNTGLENVTVYPRKEVI
ncbi:putative phage tail protein [Tissierellaceae bacterium HCP3S3_D8]